MRLKSVIFKLLMFSNVYQPTFSNVYQPAFSNVYQPAFSNVYQQILKYKENDYINPHDTLWEPYIVQRVCDYLEDNTDFLDIGSHIGLISLAVNLKNPGHGIHCIECNNLNFENLYFNTKQHSNINIYNFALGDTYKICNMIVNQTNSGCTHINSTMEIDGTKEVYDYSYLEQVRFNYTRNNIFLSVIPLDSIPFINRISVIKIDVEGFEYFVLLGAKQFLEKHRPTIIIEIDIEKIEKTDLLLNKLNYVLFEILQNGNYIYKRTIK